MKKKRVPKNPKKDFPPAEDLLVVAVVEELGHRKQVSPQGDLGYHNPKIPIVGLPGDLLVLVRRRDFAAQVAAAEKAYRDHVVCPVCRGKAPQVRRCTACGGLGLVRISAVEMKEPPCPKQP